MKKWTLLVFLLMAGVAFSSLRAQSCNLSGPTLDCITRNSTSSFSVNFPVSVLIGVDPNKCITHKWKVEGGTIQVLNAVGQFVSVGSEVCFTEDITQCGGDCAALLLLPTTNLGVSSIRIRWDDAEAGTGKVSVEIKEKGKIPIEIPTPFGKIKISIPFSNTLCSDERSGTLVPVNPTGISRSNISCSSNGTATFTVSFSDPNNCGGFNFRWFRNGQDIGTTSSPVRTISGLGLIQSHTVGVEILRNGQTSNRLTASFATIDPIPNFINGFSTIQGGGSYTYEIPNTNISSITWTIEPFNLNYTQYLQPSGNNRVFFSPPFDEAVINVTLRAVGTTNCGFSFSKGKAITIENDIIPRPGTPTDVKTESEPVSELADLRPSEQIQRVATSVQVDAPEINIFPNPIGTGQLLNIKLKEVNPDENNELRVLNSNGQLVWRQSINENWVELSTNGFSPGVHYLQIISSEGTYSKRLVILN